MSSDPDQPANSPCMTAGEPAFGDETGRPLPAGIPMVLSSGHHLSDHSNGKIPDLPNFRPETDLVGAGERNLPERVHPTMMFNQRGLSGSTDHYLTIYRGPAYRAAGATGHDE